jgi:hypothetical protein
MINSYQSIYVMVHRWIFKNFGQGKLPQTKSLFNVSFLLIVVLTNVLMVMQFMVSSHLVHLNAETAIYMLLGTAFFMLLNYLVLLNNKWLKSLNDRMAILSRHNKNIWSVVLLLNVIVVCVFSIAMVK